MAGLYDPVTALAGVGAVRAGQLESLGIRTLYDLIAFFPRDYEDRTVFVPIDRLEPGATACFRALVVTQPRTAHIRRGMDLTKLTVSDDTGKLGVTFFNQSYVADQLRYGEEYCFCGRVDESFQITNPAFEPAASAGRVTGRILPVYALTAGVSNKLMGKLVGQALDACAGSIPEILPLSVRERFSLCGAEEAYGTVHRPESFEALARARKRLVFEEFFIFSAGLAILRARRRGEHRDPLPNRDVSPFLAALPFSLTGAQRRAVDEILSDFAGGASMNRLVQGDVGSGKTMVAAAAAYCAAMNGRQTALMAPTEILAGQHYALLAPLFERFGFRTVLLTGSLRAAEKRAAREAAADGSASLVIGTHALLSGDVTFHNLDLVVTDEQHRFGVAQRAALGAKGRDPHLLVMSATPIPRTLALILYGDLDVSVIDELPPGRQSVDTFLVGESMRRRINAFIRRQAEEGHQVYIVCPAVEENEETSLKSAEVWAEALQRSVFPDLRVGLIHGRMKSAEKEAVMAAFAAGETQILVATTVIEVGMDVPNATLMVIENAEQFGLSQLHQLRGRVGRGKDKSYCVLFSSNPPPETLARLSAFCATTDGFKIAEEDLKLRGPGDFFGSRQHGLPAFKAASLTCDLDTLTEAREAAGEYLAAVPDRDEAELEPLRARIRALFRDDLALN